MVDSAIDRVAHTAAAAGSRANTLGLGVALSAAAHVIDWLSYQVDPVGYEPQTTQDPNLRPKAAPGHPPAHLSH
jgi:hypothetical protein